MPALYLEPSAALSWLLGEPDGESVRARVDGSDVVLSVTLTLVEIERALLRAEHDGRLTSAERGQLRGLLARQSAQWTLLEFTAQVRERASRAFPVEPVRSLDAIHLASALQVLELFPDRQVLTLDDRVHANLAPLGLVPAQMP